MKKSNPYSQRNAEERERLTRIAENLTDAQAALPAGGAGWTVGGILGHLAFWDQRATGLLRKWKKNAIGPSAIDVDAVNDATRPLLNALSARAVARLATASAEEVDQEIDSLDEAMLERIEAAGKPVRLDRAEHRIHHLGQIEKVIGQAAR